MSAAPAPEPPTKPPRKKPVFVKPRRQIIDLETRARVWADYITCGAIMTARTWNVDRRTVYNIVGECNEDAAFRAQCQDALVALRAAMFERSLDAQMVATVALRLRLQDSGHSVPDLLAAVVQLSKVNGNHRGDQSAAAQNPGRGAAIALPFILTTPRLDPDAPGPGNSPQQDQTDDE